MSERIRSENRSSQGLAARRRRNRRRALVALGILLLVAAGVIIYALWRPAFRITDIEVFGSDLPLAGVALRTMEGSYFGLAPRDSTFLIPESKIRTEILEAYPTIAAVSLFRNGFTGLTIKATDRAAIGRWCGSAPLADGTTEDCYLFDASGVVFASAASSTPVLNPFVLYASLEGEPREPLHARLRSAAKLPSTFDFARVLSTLGTATTRIVIAGDEVSLHASSGTRIRYVLGREQAAYAALVSAKENLDLSSGSLEYVDLRFEGRVYVKRIDTAPQEVESQ